MSGALKPVRRASGPVENTSIERDGFAVYEGVLPDESVHELIRAVNAIPAGDEVRRKHRVYGVRNLARR